MKIRLLRFNFVMVIVIYSLLILKFNEQTNAAEITANPALFEIFDEGLPQGVQWVSASEKPVRDSGGYAGNRYAYFSTRDQKLSIKGLSLRVRENPSEGEYRYLSFAWRKWGSGQIALQIDQPNSTVTTARPGAQYGYRYDAGTGPAVEGQSLRVAETAPGEWTQVTRDLWKDFGDVTIEGLTFISVGGRDAGVDRIYLARTQNDLKGMIPAGQQVAQIDAPVERPPLAASQTSAPVELSQAQASNPASGVDGKSVTFVSRWSDKLKHAGWAGVLQLLLTIFGAMFVFERLFNLRRKYIIPSGLTEQARMLWNSGNYDQLIRLKETNPSTLARVISFIAENRDSSLHDVSAIAGELVSRELDIHYRKAYPLGIVATLAPLLGLLGMILGMIETFEIVATAGSLGDPTQLASGISEALVTTGLGLAIAIPFLALYHYFKHMTAGFGVQLEEQVTSLLTGWLLKKRTVEEG